MKFQIDYEKLLTILIMIFAIVSLIANLDKSFKDLFWHFTTIVLGVSAWYKKNKLDGLA